jgi:prepilin peptidase CpaA
MYLPFFPDPLFGWVFLIALWAFMGTTSVIDYRFMVVPKWLTLTALPLGLLFNAVRGGWLGSQTLAVWVLPPGGAALGVLDGILFGLAGFLLGFALFFVMWILGACGGGDVKLFAAVGAWVGPGRAVGVLCLTLVVVALIVFCQIALKMFRGDWKSLRRRPEQRKMKTGSKPPRGRLSYALPLTIAVTAVLLWSCRVDLQFVPPGEVTTAKVEGHAK